MQRKEELAHEIENRTNQLRKVNVVLDHLKKKWEVETMKVRVKLEKQLQQTVATAKKNRDKSISDTRNQEDELANRKIKRSAVLSSCQGCRRLWNLIFLILRSQNLRFVQTNQRENRKTGQTYERNHSKKPR